MKSYIEKAMSFSEYIALIDRMLTEGKTTGPNQSEEMLHYAKLNRQRMRRLKETVELNPELVMRIGALDVNWVWLVLTEGWCGDAAQNIPPIEKIAAENPGIKTLYLLRDENLDLMDQYLTNGGRAIPILICIDGDTMEVLGRWGSRPVKGQEHFLAMKAAGIVKPELSENMQRWYNADKENSIQKDFAEIIKEWAVASTQKQAA